MTTLQKRFEILRELRPEITNADLTRLTGAKAPSVGDWFNGDTKSLRGDTAAKVADVYGISPYWLVTGEGPMLQPKIPEAYQAFSEAHSVVGMTAVPMGTAKITRPTPMKPETERRLTRLLAVLYQIPEGQRAPALAAATEVLLDHLPPPPTA